MYGINSKKHYANLNLIRGLAAITVMLYHVRYEFFVTYDKISNPTLIEKIIIFICDLGHAAVIVFFVLSGFFISSSILKAAINNEWSWKDYFIARCSRLYVVLIPALALTFFWDHLGNLWGFPSYTHGSESWSALLGNLLFLQKIYFPTYGSDDPLWSLSYEFWYYIIFPLIFFAIYSFKVPSYKKIPAISIAIILLFAVGKVITMYFLIWLFGFVLVVISAPEENPKKAGALTMALSILAILFFLLSLVLERLRLIESQFSNDLLIGITFSIFMYTILNFRREPTSKVYSYVTSRLAGFAYTLYLVHFPVVEFLANSVFKVKKSWNFDFLHMCYGILIMASILVYAITVWYFTEAKTRRVRVKITELLS